MTEFYIAITTRDWEFVRTSLFTNDGCENAGVLLCGISKSELETRLLVRKFVPVPRKFYAHRSEYHLEVSPSFYNEIISACIRNRHTPVIIHSHPHNDEAWYSRSDYYGEGRLLPVLESLVPSSLAASLVVTPTSVTGRRLTARTFVTLSGLKIFGLTSKIAHFSSSAEKYQ